MVIICQDHKEIINSKQIINIMITNCDEDGFGIFAGVTNFKDDNYRLLGYYKTERRAKDILNHIMTEIVINKALIGEMPKE